MFLSKYFYAQLLVQVQVQYLLYLSIQVHEYMKPSLHDAKWVCLFLGGCNHDCNWLHQQIV